MMTLLLVMMLQRSAEPKPPTDTERLVALQLSKECRDAGDKFWSYKKSAFQTASTADYSTHYSRADSMCFIKAQIIMGEIGKVGTTMVLLVNDAVEGTHIGSKSLRYDGTEWVTVHVDGPQEHTHHDPTPADIAWFDSLMVR